MGQRQNHAIETVGKCLDLGVERRVYFVANLELALDKCSVWVRLVCAVSASQCD